MSDIKLEKKDIKMRKLYKRLLKICYFLRKYEAFVYPLIFVLNFIFLCFNIAVLNLLGSIGLFAWIVDTALMVIAEEPIPLYGLILDFFETVFEEKLNNEKYEKMNNVLIQTKEKMNQENQEETKIITQQNTSSKANEHKITNSTNDFRYDLYSFNNIDTTELDIEEEKELKLKK